MYYKIENKECEVYKKLHELRTSEIKIKEENEKAIQERIGDLTYERYLGYSGQQNFRRVPQYTGFAFLNTEKVDSKIWKLDDKRDGLYIPNKKTKLGREMAEFLLNGLKGSRYNKIFEILGFDREIGKFTFPYVEICDNENIVVYLGDKEEPNDPNLIEITKKEFDTLLA